MVRLKKFVNMWIYLQKNKPDRQHQITQQSIVHIRRTKNEWCSMYTNSKITGSTLILRYYKRVINAYLQLDLSLTTMSVPFGILVVSNEYVKKPECVWIKESSILMTSQVVFSHFIFWHCLKKIEVSATNFSICIQIVMTMCGPSCKDAGTSTKFAGCALRRYRQFKLTRRKKI